MRNKAMKMPRILLVQFYSELLTRNENPQAKEYYDKLYRTRRGYNRFGPVWEIPVWIAEMKRNFPDADVVFAKSIADVQSKQGNYTHLAFSAMDCNVDLIREIADGFSGTVIAGGYVENTRLTDLQNVFWFHSVQNCCNFFGVEYKPGIDYSDFAGAKTIARLTLSTGCKHKCKFCIQPDDVKKTPIDDVYQQADEICKLNSPLVYVNDKTFGQAENFWLLPKLFGYIADNMVDYTFDGFIVQTTASQLLKLDDDFLVASGIRYVELGIETYNNAILADMRKPANEKLIDAATKKLRRLGIRLIPNILIGLPDETQTTYSRTLHWLSANADVISHLNIYNLVVYCDAEIADEIEFADNATDENRIADDADAELFATLLYTFGMKCLNNPADVCDRCGDVCPTQEIVSADVNVGDAALCNDCTRTVLGDRVMIDYQPAIDAEIAKLESQQATMPTMPKSWCQGLADAVGDEDNSCDSCGNETDVKAYTVDQTGRDTSEICNACEHDDCSKCVL